MTKDFILWASCYFVMCYFYLCLFWTSLSSSYNLLKEYSGSCLSKYFYFYSSSQGFGGDHRSSGVQPVVHQTLHQRLQTGNKLQFSFTWHKQLHTVNSTEDFLWEDVKVSLTNMRNHLQCCIDSFNSIYSLWCEIKWKACVCFCSPVDRCVWSDPQSAGSVQPAGGAGAGQRRTQKVRGQIRELSL